MMPIWLAVTLLAVTLLVGIAIGLGATGELEPLLEPVVAFFAGSGPKKPSLVPIDYNPFLPYWDI